MSRVKNPREKKRLSLARDRRNWFGENDKASRKAIPRNKRRVNRANRHAAATELTRVLGTPDLDAAETVESHVEGRRPVSWRKQADLPLGEVVEHRLAFRAAHSPDAEFPCQGC
jgi:hypothetical protein